MDISWPVLYRIDIDDRLAELNDGWLAFAQANGGDALHPSKILGRSLWEFIADAESRSTQKTPTMPPRPPCTTTVSRGGFHRRFRASFR